MDELEIWIDGGGYVFKANPATLKQRSHLLRNFQDLMDRIDEI